MLRRREQLLGVMATEVCQAREGVTIDSTSQSRPTAGDARPHGRPGPLPHHLRPRLPGARAAPGKVATFAGDEGFEARVVDRVDTLYLLVDRHLVLLNLTVPGSRSPAATPSLLMRHAGLGQTLHDAFRHTLGPGRPIRARPSGRAAHPPSWAQRPARAATPRSGGAGRRQQRPLGLVRLSRPNRLEARGTTLAPGLEYPPPATQGSVRVVGGRLGGRRLRAFPAATRRPTSDRVKEALFGVLEQMPGRGCSTCSPGPGRWPSRRCHAGPPQPSWSSRPPRR